MIQLRRHLNQSHGFSLIEMLITLGIIASLMGFGVSALNAPKNNMKDTGRNLIRVIKYIYNQAAVTNTYYRLTIDMSEGKYKAETSTTPFYVIKEGDEIEEIRIKNENQGSDVDEDEVAASKAAAVGSFGEAEDEVLEIYEVPEGIKIASVYVMHQEDLAEEGKAYIYFFPKGLTEFAVIHLSDNDEENFMTLIVNPLTGNVQVRREFVDHDTILGEYQ